MTRMEQLMIYRNEIKTYLPRVTRKQFDYILAEHTSWPEFSEELAAAQVARYMSMIGIQRQGKTHQSRPNRSEKAKKGS